MLDLPPALLAPQGLSQASVLARVSHVRKAKSQHRVISQSASRAMLGSTRTSRDPRQRVRSHAQTARVGSTRMSIRMWLARPVATVTTRVVQAKPTATSAKQASTGPRRTQGRVVLTAPVVRGPPAQDRHPAQTTCARASMGRPQVVARAVHTDRRSAPHATAATSSTPTHARSSCRVMSRPQDPSPSR